MVDKIKEFAEQIESFEKEKDEIDFKIAEVRDELTKTLAEAQVLFKKYPATIMVHWASGDTPCCSHHAEGLKRIGGVMGSNTPTSPLKYKLPCMNCFNEDKDNE